MAVTAWGDPATLNWVAVIVQVATPPALVATLLQMPPTPPKVTVPPTAGAPPPFESTTVAVKVTVFP